MISFAFIIGVFITRGTVYARWEELSVEAQWRFLNPKPYHLPNHWDEADTLTHDQHKRICDDVLLQTIDYEEETYKDYNYVNASDILKERVVKNMPVEFRGGIGDTLPLTLVICRYNETEFYLAQGDTDSVFKLVRDPFWGIIFKSGLHPVMYDPYRYGEHNSQKPYTISGPKVL